MSKTNLLFGAEVDSIQEMLFQAARQRQVVGGSRLLDLFGGQVKQSAGDGNRVLASAGGQVRAIFSGDDEKEVMKAATEFGEKISNAYHLLLGGSMTLGEPQPLANDGANFKKVNEELFDSMARSKRAERGTQSVPHASTTAFGEYSGRALANQLQVDLDQPKDSLRRSRYLSQVVANMQNAGKPERDGTEEATDSFLGDIYKKIPSAPCNYETLTQPGGEMPAGTNIAQSCAGRWAEQVEDIAQLDPMGNVAYLVADGNGLGELFQKCETPDQYEALSQAMINAMRYAVAYPIEALAHKFEAELAKMREMRLPLLPLIVAGDDCFVLLPAKYALDYARCFCLAFEQAMQAEFEKAGCLFATHHECGGGFCQRELPLQTSV